MLGYWYPDEWGVPVMKLWDGMNSKKFDAQMLQISAHQVDLAITRAVKLTRACTQYPL